MVAKQSSSITARAQMWSRPGCRNMQFDFKTSFVKSFAPLTSTLTEARIWISGGISGLIHFQGQPQKPPKFEANCQLSYSWKWPKKMVDVEALHILGLVLVGAVAVTSGWPLGKLLGHKVSWTALLPDTGIHCLLYQIPGTAVVRINSTCLHFLRHKWRKFNFWKSLIW